MSKRDTFGPDYFRMGEHVRIMQTREAVVNLLHRGGTGYNLLDTFSFGCGMGLDHYPTEFVEYVESSDDDDDFGSQNNRYCGFSPNFLNRGFPNTRPAIGCFKPVKRISPEEAAKNAKELLDEEEKLKKKAEKKKQKKMRQRERRRLEKVEKENTDKDKNKKISSVATDSSDSSDEEDDDDKGSLSDDLQELDMNSCFVTNAAAIAKRKLEQKPKSDRKDKKAENSRKYEAEKKTVAEPQIRNHENEEGSGEAVNDFVTKSMELAVTGNAYAQAGNLDMAVKFFTDAIKHNPKEFKLFGNRSFCYEKMQQYEKALIDADIALSLNPTWIKGLYRKGKALVGLKRYYDASLTYKEVLKLDSSCTDAAQELMRVRIMQLMDMGFTREQSSNALIIHGTVEKALEALSGLQGSVATATVPSEVSVEEDWIRAERNPHPHKVPLRTVLQNQPRANTAVKTSPQELFPIWVGDLVPALSESKIYELFRVHGPVHSVRVLQDKRCAFVNYINKEDSKKAIRDMHGYAIAGTSLVVRYPDRIYTHLGASKTAATDTGKVSKLPEECFFWRTTGCIKNNRCAYKHVPEHKGIDRPKAK
ncbi:uncharacterized protein si:dkey-33c12.4 isoform X2 [Colossoma macropomum]|uniref:uncharacterized protein si:dkey-33c12.4 isoform X2 n=1 Tax=Colossoma macropomum TaxID=42526 RepID=UPI001864066C|nr:uncharacterized protein si:dkey-33c12.4 isoform X2 [Colossoma macropomum]